MTLTFHLPGLLRRFTDGKGTIVLEGSARSVREALEVLFARHPGVRDRILTELDEVRPHVNVFVGGESIRYCGGLDGTIPGDASIWIIPAVSGGRGPSPAAPAIDLDTADRAAVASRPHAAGSPNAPFPSTTFDSAIA